MKLLTLLSFALLTSLGLSAAISPQGTEATPAAIFCSASCTGDWLQCKDSNSGAVCVKDVCKRTECGYLCPFCTDQDVAGPQDASAALEANVSEIAGAACNRPCQGNYITCLKKHNTNEYCTEWVCGTKICNSSCGFCSGFVHNV